VDHATTASVQVDSFTEDAGCDEHLGVEGGVETIDGLLFRVAGRAAVDELNALVGSERIRESPDAVFLMPWIPGREIGCLLGNGLEASGPARLVAREETMHLREVDGGIVCCLEPVDFDLKVRGGNCSGRGIYDICSRV